MRRSLLTPIKYLLRPVKRAVLRLANSGRGRNCPICGRESRRFLSFGALARTDVRCAHCDSLERHRLTWLYFCRRTDLFDGRPKRMLHFAPEACMRERLASAIGAGYVTADLIEPTVMARMDIERIAAVDDTFDVVYCSHVLEHVPHDRIAMHELHRVLKPGGWAILLVPITSGATDEDPSVTDPDERLRLFGQVDHVRRYGPDYVDRLREAGFDVLVTRPRELCSPQEIESMRLTGEAVGEIYYCVKRQNRSP